MNRLAKAIEAGRTMMGKSKKKTSPKKRPVDNGNRLSKAIGRCREIKASEGLDEKLTKGRHDALYYHACNAEAASRAVNKVEGKEDRIRLINVSKKHMFMFLRHCLEAVRDSSNAGSMKYNMTKYCDFYCGLSYEACGDWDNPSSLIVEFKDGRGYEPSPDDSFIEDYEDDGEPELESIGDGGSSEIALEASY